MAKSRVSNFLTFVTDLSKYFNKSIVSKTEFVTFCNRMNLCIPSKFKDLKVGRNRYDLEKVEGFVFVPSANDASNQMHFYSSIGQNVPIMNYVPVKNENYVKWGHYKDLKTIIKSGKFFPVFITGLSGNGKTAMVYEACADTKREMIRAHITIETDEYDLLGGFQLKEGETRWCNGPVVEAMLRGGILLLDEVDLASHKIMCLQPILEGKGIYLKKINKLVEPAPGFNIVATANTKGKGSEDGQFVGTNILNEAFLDRFAITFFQKYAPNNHEEKILLKVMETENKIDLDFVNKLVKWSDAIRKSYESGAIDEIITTRRLLHIVKSWIIFDSKMKAIESCIERFDPVVKQTFIDMYALIDKDIDPMKKEEEREPEEEQTVLF